MLIEDLRQADVADALGVSRATVSVAHARGHIRSIDRLARRATRHHGRCTARPRRSRGSRHRTRHYARSHRRGPMIADPTLTLALLVFAHLVSDFVIQTDRIATEKFGTGRRAWRGLGKHVLGVGICLDPVRRRLRRRGARAARRRHLRPRHHRPVEDRLDPTGRGGRARRSPGRACRIDAGRGSRLRLDGQAGRPLRPRPGRPPRRYRRWPGRCSS